MATGRVQHIPYMDMNAYIVYCDKTLGGDIITRCAELPIGVTVFQNSNNPPHQPSGYSWDGYIIFKATAENVKIFAISSTYFAYAVFNPTTATSISWIKLYG